MRTWFALLGAPVLALMNQSVSYATVGWSCAHRHPLALHAVHGAVLQNFSYELSADGEVFYTGESLFGYLSAAALANQVGLEDASLVASVQVGLNSGMIPHGRLLPSSEVLIQHFQRLVHDALSGD